MRQADCYAQFFARDELKEYVNHDYQDGSKPTPIIVDSRHLMGRGSSSGFNRMKNPVKIYRGCSRVESDVGFGQSWTISKPTAKNFAFRIKGHSKTDSVVFEATIDKKHIFAYVNDRRERECIINTAKLECVRISRCLGSQ